MKSLIRIIFFWVFATCSLGKVTYDGFKVYQVTPNSFEELRQLHSIKHVIPMDFWNEAPINKPSDIMIAPENQLQFESLLRAYDLEFEIAVQNVKSLLLQSELEKTQLRVGLSAGSVTFRSFMTHHEQMVYLRSIAEMYPNIASLESIGKSYEGRDLLLVRISSGPSKVAQPKPIIFIDAGIHAREWIAPPVALYIINQLVENPTNAEMFQNVDWAIIPNLNPDGYHYTHTTDRLWRKTRQPNKNSICVGADPNRNFDYMWMESGASNDSCSSTFAGPSAFSEPETAALRDWFNSNGDNVKLYLTFHSYGEYILYPWGYAEALPEDAPELQKLGDQVARAIMSASTIGSKYIVGNTVSTLYAAAGGSYDWVKGVAGVNLSFTLELPKGDAPQSFLIPARQILPVVEETFEGVREFWRYIKAKFVNGRNSGCRRFI